MRTRRSSGLVVAAVLALAAGWLFFAPRQLGGSTTWTSTLGNSMEPLYHKGDLALSRPASTYRVGDVVLYDSPVFHRPVLHRIVAIRQGRYFFKGDHNDFVDPGFATQGELLGRPWLRIPHAGTALTWIGKPFNAAAVSGLVTLLLLGAPAERRPRRRRGGRRRRRSTDMNMVARHVHRPRKTPENAAFGLALLAAAVLGAVGFAQPRARTVEVAGAYANSGTFSYTARATQPTLAYPSGRAGTGDPLFLNSFKVIQTRFDYRFRSALPHHVAGTIALNAEVSADSGWHQAYPLSRTVKFDGDRTTITANAPVTELRSLLARVSQDAGAVGASYTISLRPVVRLHGVVGRTRIRGTFTPELPFTATDALLKLNLSAPAPPPGATYSIDESRANALSAGLHPVQNGSVVGRAPNLVSLLVVRVADSTARGLALGFLGLALVSLLLKAVRPRRDEWSAEQRIAYRRKVVVVDVVELDPLQPRTAVPDFTNLAVLAQYCERPVFRDGSTYAVEDGGRLYTYEAAEAPAATSAPSLPAPGTRRRATRPFAVLLGLLAVVGVVGVGFTAGTIVPPSNAGASTHVKAARDLKPSACTRPVSSVVRVPAGGARFTVATANNLILGTNGNDDVVAATGYNCFVGGGPVAANSDNFTGPASGNDECIVAATAKAKNITHCAIVSRTP